MAQFDTYQDVTDSIINQLEAGTMPWRRTWSGGGALREPLRSCGTPYRGINVLLLWMAAAERGYANRNWLTFKQAQALGGMVRKGEKATRIVFFKKLEVADRDAPEGSDETKLIPMLRTYAVFNASQIEGLPDRYADQLAPVATIERDSDKEAALRSSGAEIVEGGLEAYYLPSADRVHMPDFERFASAGGYLATLAHELCHWTGHKSRLDRDQRGTFGGPDYAKEELVAELGAAFVGARLGIVGDHIDNHAAYLQSWLKALRNDKRCIFKAAAQAQAAADMVLANAGPIADQAKPGSFEGEPEPVATPAPAEPQLQLAL